MIFTITSKLLSLVLFIIILCAVIAIHEAGHLLFAKKNNVYCYEYSIGFGPEIYRNTKHETHFVIRSIPLGGFVKIAGEEGQDENIKDNNSNDIPENRLLKHVKPSKKVLILAGGGIMNMILAYVSFFIYIAFNHGFALPSTDNRITISTDTQYELASKDIETGDKILYITTWLNDSDNRVCNDKEITKFDEITTYLSYNYPSQVGDIQHVEIKYFDVSENTTKIIEASRTMLEDGTISLLGVGQYINSYEYNVLTATYGTFHFMGINAIETIKAFGKLFTGHLENVSGLVGIYQVVDGVTEIEVDFMSKLVYYIYLTGAISFSLGFFNLIPFPALDGGRITFVLINACLKKKKINPDVEATIHSVGLILLFIFMIVINVKDVIGVFK